MKKFLVTSTLITGLMMAQSASADIFNLTVTVDSETKNFGFSNAEEFIRTNEDSRLETLFPNYNSNSAVSSSLDFRGLPATVSMDANSTSVRLLIPSLNIDKTFAGANRDASVDDLVDFFQDEGGDLLNQIQKELAAVSAEDILAGNPNSLQSSLVETFYNIGTPGGLGFEPVLGGPADSKKFLTSTDNYVLSGATVDMIDADGSTGYELNVPLGYSFGFNDAPGYRLNVQMPLSYTSIESADAYKVGFVADLQVPAAENWYLYPYLGYGAAGSEDLASLGQMLAGGVTSKYHFRLDDKSGISFILGNTLGYTESLKLSIGDYEFDPELSNTHTRNGLNAYIPVEKFIPESTGNLKVGYSNTQFYGTELFIENYHDIEIGWVGKLGKTTEGSISSHYTIADDYSEIGLRFRLAY